MRAVGSVPPPADYNILKEDGFNLLLETGGKILLENGN